MFVGRVFETAGLECVVTYTHTHAHKHARTHSIRYNGENKAIVGYKATN